MIDRHSKRQLRWREVFKSSLLLLLGTGLLSACKPHVEPQAAPEVVGLPVTRLPAEVFRESTRRYLLVTKSAEASCDTLLGPELASVFTRQGQEVLCGGFKVDLETIKGRLNRVYGKNITIPWEESGDLLTAAFEIAGDVEMPVFLFRNQRAVLFQLPENGPRVNYEKP